MFRFLALCLVLSNIKSAGAETLTVAISDFPPSIDLSDKHYGIHGTIVLNALNRIGQPYQIKIFSWSRIAQMLDTQDICSFGWVKNKDRLTRWQYSVPYHADISYLWGRKDNQLNLASLEDATHYRIGVTRGFSYGQQFDDVLRKVETDEGFDDTVNLRKLLGGRIDLFPGQALIIKPILASRFAEQADELEPKLEINRLSHHFVCNIHSELGRQTIRKINPLLPDLE